MENLSPPSSQELSSAALPSAPPSPPQKPKRPPPVTPKRLQRFFAPRDGGRKRGALQELPDAAVNVKRLRRNGDSASQKAALPTPQSSPLGRHALELGPGDEGERRERRAGSGGLEDSCSPETSDNDAETRGDVEMRLPSSIEPSGFRASHGDPFRREIGYCNRDSSNICVDWRSEVCDFYSAPADAHEVYIEDPSDRLTLPYCLASCNTNSLTAIGDEDGMIRLLDTDAAADFAEPHLLWRGHSNAIFDLSFSHDDQMLATGSGDQCCKVVDMPTQRTTAVLVHHTGSVKCVRWKGPGSILATCSRDGSIAIWDLRSPPYRPDYSFKLPGECDLDGGTLSAPGAAGQHKDAKLLRPEKKIMVAHARDSHGKSGRRNEGSAAACSSAGATAIAWLAGARSHFFLSAGDYSSCVNLWDSRYVHRRNPLPISTTLEPRTQSHTRRCGVSSLVVDDANSRFYTLCKKESTVYAYSAEHLVLGAASLDGSIGKARYGSTSTRLRGIGPMFALRHPKLQASSFFVRMAIRTAPSNRARVLAVGSTLGSPIVFPLDERHLPRAPWSNVILAPSHPLRSDAFDENVLPIYAHGAALSGAHRKEVSAVAWSHDGDLISVGDDYVARLWREDADSARTLRRGLPPNGRRADYGWSAEFGGETWDESDCE